MKSRQRWGHVGAVCAEVKTSVDMLLHPRGREDDGEVHASDFERQRASSPGFHGVSDVQLSQTQSWAHVGQTHLALDVGSMWAKGES